MIRLSSSCRTRPREVEPHDERKHLKIRMPGGQERNSKEFEALVKRQGIFPSLLGYRYR